MSIIKGLLIASFIYNFLIIFVYFSKARLKTRETNLYSLMLIINIIGVALEFLCIFFASRMTATGEMVQESLATNIIARTYLIYLLVWISAFTVYVYSISYNSNKRIYKFLDKHWAFFKGFMWVVFFTLTLLLSILPMYFYNDGMSAYTWGPAINMLIVLFSLSVAFNVFSTLYNFKDIKFKRYLPVFGFLVGIVLVIVPKMIDPEIQLVATILTITTIIMYFTIENPDIKILNELYKNKELMEQSYEDKYNFLFEITQEARTPLIKINSICESIKEEKNPEEVKSALASINTLVKQLDFSINDVLNISTLDVQKLHFINNKYNLNQMCKDLVAKVGTIEHENVEFRYNFPQVTPTLYGDYIKIKQILYSLLLNAFKHTNNGFVEFNVSLIERYDVCRIVFNILDSGAGIPINLINEILGSTGEFDEQEIKNLETSEYNVKVCQKIIKIMNGNLIIKSDVGKGTEIRLAIDQQIYVDDTKTVLNDYEKVINTYKSILIVSQDDELTNKIKKKCRENDIMTFNLKYGKDAVDRIKAGKKYDFILLSDEMKEMSGLTTLQEIQKNDEINAPMIVMLKGDKENIKEHYLNDGFTDYLLIDNFESEISRIIDKY